MMFSNKEDRIKYIALFVRVMAKIGLADKLGLTEDDITFPGISVHDVEVIVKDKMKELARDDFDIEGDDEEENKIVCGLVNQVIHRHVFHVIGKVAELGLVDIDFSDDRFWFAPTELGMEVGKYLKEDTKNKGGL